MKITDIKVFNLKADKSNWLLLKIETDEDIYGWGDISDSFIDNCVADIVVNSFKNLLVGKNPLEIKNCREQITKWRYPILNNVRPYAIAVSGVDQALWDITAKAYNLPLYKLYGADGVKEIKLYANLNNAIRNERTADAFYRQAVAAKEMGFEAVKCTPFDEINPTVPDVNIKKAMERLKAVIEVWPIEKVAIDCHQRFGRYNLGIAVKEILDKFGNPYWIEDPVPVLDYETVRKMNTKYPEICWVAGEDSFMAEDLMRTVASNCYDVVMPDVKYIGGPTVIKGLITAVEGMGKKLTIHNPSGIISTAHSAHIMALCNGFPLEYPIGALSEREKFCIPNENIKDGKYIFNDNPGIGIDFNEEYLEKYAMQYSGMSWIEYRR